MNPYISSWLPLRAVIISVLEKSPCALTVTDIYLCDHNIPFIIFFVNYDKICINIRLYRKSDLYALDPFDFDKLNMKT